jgi:hypothetical protein
MQSPTKEWISSFFGSLRSALRVETPKMEMTIEKLPDGKFRVIRTFDDSVAPRVAARMAAEWSGPDPQLDKRAVEPFVQNLLNRHGDPQAALAAITFNKTEEA